MRIDGLTATADLVGRRVRLGWTFIPEAGETIADVPMVTVRRKERDFAFPPPAPGDPYLLYDSAAFPPSPVPGALIVADLPDRETREGDLRIIERSTTVAEVVDGPPREVLRRTVRSVLSPEQTVVRQQIELLDVGGLGGSLQPGVGYYYELARSAPAPGAAETPLRATVRPGEAYGMNRSLYQMLPEIYRRHDAVARTPDAGTGLLPEASTNGGQLRRFIDVFGMALDAIRSSAEGLWDIHDPATVDPELLPLLAQWIGWDLTVADDLPRQRNEIRNAPRLYSALGTIPALRTMVDHYTGWSSRVVEFVQHIARTNLPPQRNIFGLTARAGTWWGIDDAAPLLGFAPPNHEEIGAAGTAAELTGAAVEPFPLRAAMSLTIAVDGALPYTLTFGAADFEEIGAATADEVAAVIDRESGGLHGEAVGGAIRLRSHRVGEGSRVQVLPSNATLLSLEGAPAGRLATTLDADERLWLAHAGNVGPGAGPPSRLFVKPHLRGAWHDARVVEDRPRSPQADPAIVSLPDGRLWLAWIDWPGTARSTLRWRVGDVQPLTPARLLGRRSGPFALVVGGQVVLTGYGAPETFVVQAADFASPGAATGAEVAAAMNAQLAGVTASVVGTGELELRTVATGPGIGLRVDLANSTAARALGFDDRALIGRGGWDSAVDWAGPAAVSSMAAGWHAGCTAVVDPEGAVRLFWSTHRHRRWRIARARWDDRVLAATASGAGMRAASGAWTSVAVGDGLPSDDVRGIATDADGSTWYATGAGAAVRRPDGTVEVLSNATTGGGLADDDVRAVAVAPGGRIWFAHAAGASGMDPGGVWQTVTSGDGLAGDDCRHVTVSNDGTAWFATTGGLSRLEPDGTWRSWTAADGLPAIDVRHASVDPDGAVWLATSAGVARLDAALALSATSLEAAGAPPGADDVRAVSVAPPSPGRGASTWCATAAGVIELRPSRRVEAYGLASGLPSADCRAVLLMPDGAVWVATAAGLAHRAAPGAGWEIVTAADGLPDDNVRALHGPWSAPLEFEAAAAGDRDPVAVLDDAGRIWLAWAERQAIADAAETYLIRARRLAWPDFDWSPSLPITTAPPGGRASDREPSFVPAAGGGGTLYFRSDRDGGPRIWSVDIDGADAASAPVAVTGGESGDSSPASVALPDGSRWLLLRSDRSLALSRLGGGLVSAPGRVGASSRRAPDEASLRHFAGAVTVVLDDLDRNRGRRQFGDLLCYTPQRPDGDIEGPLAPDELYTRGTIGLYVERGPAGRPLTRRDADRLRQLLDRFLPVNIRAVIVLRPSGVLLEHVFAPGQDLADSYEDNYPFAEAYDGPTDDSAASLPDWLLFLATDGSSVLVDPGDLTTLRRRTWWPPPQ